MPASPKVPRPGKRVRQAVSMWKPLTSGASVGFLVAWFVLILLWPNAIGLDLRERLGRKDALEAFTSQQQEAVDFPTQQGPTARARTLVVYVFSGSDPEYADNLRFFVREAAKVQDQCSVCEQMGWAATLH